MKIVKIGEPQIIMSNRYSRHDYFGWPTVTRLKNGRIAVVASGFRLRHVCPFGKTVISYSENEGETYTLPAPVIDTVLDDRDGGIMAFGESGVMVTSFNNTLDMQRQYNDANSKTTSYVKAGNKKSQYDYSYLDMITPEEEAEALGSTFRISLDNGITFGEIHKSPITSPHGPIELSDGTILWVGRTFAADAKKDRIEAHRVNLDGSMEFLGAIEAIMDGDTAVLSCEPDAIELDDGRIIVHIRAQRGKEAPMFTMYQSVSEDGGVSWSKPTALLGRLGGAPPHIMKSSSGMLICTYGYREAPYGIKAMFSKDGGNTWETDIDIYVNGVNKDLGYPSTVELSDGSFLTVFYAHTKNGESAMVMQQRWRIE